jgi:mono/diheme cytochrome c family protein
MRAVAIVITSALVACGTDWSDKAPANPDARKTWYRDAGPIIAAHCMACHQAGGIAPFALTDYDSASEQALGIVQQIQAGTMPPFYAREEPDCTPRFGWKQDPRLTKDEIDTLNAWVDDGTIAGDVAPLPPPPSRGLVGVTETLTPRRSFTASGDRDQFVCTVLDPELGHGAWLTGLQVRPGNAEVVHHVTVTEVVAGPAQDSLTAAHHVGIPWDCSLQPLPGFGVNLWSPGGDPIEMPDGIAVPITAGAKLLMQIHYHPAGRVQQPDLTALDLRTTENKPQRMYFILGFGGAGAAPELLPDPDDRTSSPEFRIPANSPDHGEHMRFTVTGLDGMTDVRFFSANPHMHLLGTHFAGRIERTSPPVGQPASECLANGTWNFDWQRTYVYDGSVDLLPTLQSGDVIDVQCRWDNTIENPFEQRALADQGLSAPVDVYQGEGQTTDEMCFENFGLSVPAPGPLGFELRSSILPPGL